MSGCVLKISQSDSGLYREPAGGRTGLSARMARFCATWTKDPRSALPCWLPKVFPSRSQLLSPSALACATHRLTRRRRSSRP